MFVKMMEGVYVSINAVTTEFYIMKPFIHKLQVNHRLGGFGWKCQWYSVGENRLDCLLEKKLFVELEKLDFDMRAMKKREKRKETVVLCFRTKTTYHRNEIDLLSWDFYEKQLISIAIFLFVHFHKCHCWLSTIKQYSKKYRENST